MNTRGEWQERLSWLCATTHQRSLPVFIYKYGRVRPGVLMKWRQRQLTDRLAKKIELLTEEYGLGTNGPDVIAHSFGTWLIGHVLMEHPSLRIGRLILAGSILRPDFDWNRPIGRRQVEAVLNHVAVQDAWVPLAQWVVPDSGPSGKKGFPHQPIVHREAGDFRHSSFFEENVMERNYEGVWDVFLGRPDERLSELQVGHPAAAWRERPRLLRELARLVVLSSLVALGTLLVLSSVVGFTEMVNRL
ncbi:MAG: alpha/beta fold hydrolase [Actinomycetota bacterium]